MLDFKVQVEFEEMEKYFLQKNELFIIPSSEESSPSFFLLHHSIFFIVSVLKPVSTP